MTQLPSISGATELTPDELLLLDCLFDGGAAAELMQRDAYAAHMNIRYPHSLTDADLLSVLGSLVDRGILRTEPDDITQVQWRLVDPSCLIYWKPVDAAWQAKVPIQSEDDPGWSRWNDLNAGRTWWNSIDELQTFLPHFLVGTCRP